MKKTRVTLLGAFCVESTGAALRAGMEEVFGSSNAAASFSATRYARCRLWQRQLWWAPPALFFRTPCSHGSVQPLP